MRIIRYITTIDKKNKLGVIIGDNVHDLAGNPLDNPQPGKRVAELKDVKLLAPCLPSKIIAVAINFPGIDGYYHGMSEPLVFIKPASCICNPDDIVENPFPNLPWWGEAELGVVIKKRLTHADEKQVRESILGFTIGNDTTVENVEGRDHHLARSKCPDSFCPLGPWIDTDFDASDCIIEAVQNGEVIRRGRSSDQVWQWPKILQWLSSWMTLEPWDVVLTGNPPDTVGMRFLENNDEYTARVHGLGELTNRFIRKD